MYLDEDRSLSINRRTFLGRASAGLGALALGSLLGPRVIRAAPGPGGAGKWRGVVNPLQRPQRAKRVIYLYMAGGPSHLETFDHKPKLAQAHGQAMPETLTKGMPIAQLQGAKLT